MLPVVPGHRPTKRRVNSLMLKGKLLVFQGNRTGLWTRCSNSGQNVRTITVDLCDEWNV